MVRSIIRLAAVCGGLAVVSSASAQLVLVPAGDNRAGTTQADANTSAFPEIVTNGYNIDPGTPYNFINDLQFPATLTEGTRTATGNIRTTSQWVGINSGRTQTAGLRFSSTGTALLSGNNGSNSSFVQSQDSFTMGFRINSVPGGGAVYRFVGSASASNPTGGFTVQPIELRRNNVALSSIAAGASANRVLRITQTGDYDLRGSYSLSRTVSGNTTLNQTASISGAFVCIADFDGNGATDLPDIFAFLNAWFNNQLSADSNANSQVDLLDIFDFLTRWFAGCS
jgi:hypothetical protein